MPSLTHLSLPAKGSDSERDTNLALSRVRDSFPPSLVLCLLALKAPFGASEEDWILEMINTSIKVDKRIVMCSEHLQASTDEMVVAPDSFEAWCGVRDGEQTIWEIGEAILEKRMA
jgi:hypothetical protein